MNKLLTRLYQKAKEQGRICQRCRWIVTVKDWAHGHKLCAGCRDALHGVNVSCGYLQPQQEPPDMTGEML